MQLDGKIIVITGASTGIGAALALALARRGARLMLAARDAARYRKRKLRKAAELASRSSPDTALPEQTQPHAGT